MDYRCACCGYLTIKSNRRGTFDICPICFWKDDDIQNEDPTLESGVNGISLIEAKENFRRYKSVRKEYRECVRDPQEGEIPK